jgi:hypothetical protein
VDSRNVEKSLHDKVYQAGGWQDGWKAAATARGMAVEFRVEWQANLVTRLRAVDTSGGSASVTGSTRMSSLVRGGRTGLMTRSRQLDRGTSQS